jgi:glycosyltransferase involved in cell wall biosynthesis
MFTFLRTVSPSWYFNLSATSGRRNYWVNFDLLNREDQELIDEPAGYSSRGVALLDMAYQAWLKGLIADENANLRTSDIRPSCRDEYRFIRRHFNPIWAFFAFGIRLAEFNNPLKDAAAFLSSMSAKRINPYARTKDWKTRLEDFHAELLAQQPRVSIVIPTLNRYKYLKDVLSDLEKQDYKNFEVLVVDQSEPFQKDFYESYDLDIKAWHQEEKALWLARNTAIQNSEGELILLFDDDSRVEPDWISSHIRCLDYFQTDISSGVSISAVGAKVPETYSYYKWSDQIDTGNVMLKKDIFRDIGLFDRQFERQRQGDGEFGLRAYLAGYANISNPDAMRLHLKVAEGGLREMGSWDGWRPKAFFDPRPVPSVLYLTRKYFGNRAAVYQILQSLLPSIVPYRFKRSKPMMVIGSILGLFLLPVTTVSVVRSWRQATVKLQEGAIIENLG